MTKTNILLQGDIGVGKTSCLRTLLPTYIDYDGKRRTGAGQLVRLASLEPGSVAPLGPNTCTGDHTNDTVIHYRYIRPLALGWDQFRNFMSIINNMVLEKAIEVQDPNRRQCHQLLDLIDTGKSFVCDACQHDFGDATEWGPSVTYVNDSLTGITTVARHLVVGLKPVLTQGNYQPIMSAIENYLMLFWGGTSCNAILLAHVDREVNPMTGVSQITAHSIGQKLVPRIVKMPDEIITATYDEGKYEWHTELPGQVLKVRRMPRGVDLTPDFSKYHLFDEETINA